MGNHHTLRYFPLTRKDSKMSLGVELSFRTGFLYAYGLMKPGLGEGNLSSTIRLAVY